MLANMLSQMLLQPAHCEGISLIFQAGAVIVNKCSAQHRNNGVIAKASLNHPLTYNGTADMTFLSSFEYVKFEEPWAPVSSGHEPFICQIYVQRRVYYVLLHTGFPRYVSSAFPICLIDISERKHIIEIVILGASYRFFLRTFCRTSLVTAFSSFFTGHRILPHPVPLSAGFSSGIASPGMKHGITCNPRHARSVRPDASERIFTFRKVARSFSPSSLLSPYGYLVCIERSPRPANWSCWRCSS